MRKEIERIASRINIFKCKKNCKTLTLVATTLSCIFFSKTRLIVIQSTKTAEISCELGV